jgi:hypothetical protein
MREEITMATAIGRPPRTGNVEDTISGVLGGIMTNEQTVNAMADAMVVAMRKPGVQDEINKIVLRSGAVIFTAVLGAVVVGRVIAR